MGSQEVRQGEVESAGQFLRWTESQPYRLQHDLVSLWRQGTSAQYLNGPRGETSHNMYL